MNEQSTDSGARRPELIAVALRAIANDAGDVVEDIRAFPGGAVAHCAGRNVAWIDEQPGRLLGAVLALHLRHPRHTLSVVVPQSLRIQAGIAARRLRQWRVSSEVSIVDGRSLTAVAPADYEAVAAPQFDIGPFVDLMTGAGAQPVVEHGVLTGEVMGLEVCRVMHDDDGPRLEVGVGSQDREAFKLMYAGEPSEVSLERVVAFVHEQRSATAEPHPLGRLAAERRMRWQLHRDATEYGLHDVAFVDGATARTSLSDAAPAFCTASIGKRNLLLACVSGTDLGAPIDTADTFERLASTHGLEESIMVIDGSTQLPILGDMATLSHHPMRVANLANLANTPR